MATEGEVVHKQLQAELKYLEEGCTSVEACLKLITSCKAEEDPFCANYSEQNKWVAPAPGTGPCCTVS